MSRFTIRREYFKVKLSGFYSPYNEDTEYEISDFLEENGIESEVGDSHYRGEFYIKTTQESNSIEEIEDLFKSLYVAETIEVDFLDIENSTRELNISKRLNK